MAKPELYTDFLGNKKWFLDGRLHREDGPAAEWTDGTKAWYLNGQCHREDGPAAEWADGDAAWWLNGNHYTFNEWCAIMGISPEEKTLLTLKYE